MLISNLSEKLHSPMFLLLARIGLGVNVLAISLLAFLPGQDLPSISVWDKANHFVAFFVLSVLLWCCYIKPKPVKQVILPLVGYGFFIEIVQSILPSRYFSLLDVFADSVGIAIGLGVVFLVKTFVVDRSTKLGD